MGSTSKPPLGCLALTCTGKSGRASANPDCAKDCPLEHQASACLLPGLVFPEISVELILTCICTATEGVATR